MRRPILVVDDEPDVVSFLKRLLEDNGHAVVTAQNGAEGLAAAKEHYPALVLLDLQMPHETGTDLYRKLRHSAEHADTPVIIISGLAGRNIAVSKGVPVLDKPIDEERLLEEVGKMLGGDV